GLRGGRNSSSSRKSKVGVERPGIAKSPLKCNPERASTNNPGVFLLSHAVARAVPSAPRGLTSVFGMGTGVTLSTQPPEKRFDFGLRIANCGFQIRNQK